MPLHLIFGPMFSGKTTKLVDIYSNLTCSGVQPHKILVINHIIDTRTKAGVISTHDSTSNVPCIHHDKLIELLNGDSLTECKYILINEAQFFCDLVEFVNSINLLEKNVYVSGLNGDYKQENFGNIKDLLPIADNVTFLKGKCSICKGSSVFTKRIIKADTVTLVGSSESYQPRCRKCLDV
tara:strand:+ start:19 stop:561 length:543 start_codon:yes stop_codon:yes gene_type:complete